VKESRDVHQIRNAPRRDLSKCPESQVKRQTKYGRTLYFSAPFQEFRQLRPQQAVSNDRSSWSLGDACSGKVMLSKLLPRLWVANTSRRLERTTSTNLSQKASCRTNAIQSHTIALCCRALLSRKISLVLYCFLRPKTSPGLDRSSHQFARRFYFSRLDPRIRDSHCLQL
jgi:hypothetical protein